ncbi:TrmB family transcriptional regulator [Pseudomonadota bacterium]
MIIKEAQNLIQTLKEIGLTASEATIYLTLLSIGTNSASIVAKNANTNRSTCYTTLINLAQKGFIERTIKNRVTYFTAMEPNFILSQLKNKQEDMKYQIENLSHTLANFELLKNSLQKKPKVVFFEGEQGVKNIMENTLTSKGILRAYACLDGLTNLLPNYFPEYYKRRVKKGIEVKAIYPASIHSYMHKLNDRKELRQSRLIPEEFNFHLDILIFDSKVAITSIKENFGVLIDSEDMANAQRRIFDLIWESTAIYDEVMTKKMAKLVGKKTCDKHPECSCC